MIDNEQILVDAVCGSQKPNAAQIAIDIILDYLMQKESLPEQAADLQPELFETA